MEISDEVVEVARTAFRESSRLAQDYCPRCGGTGRDRDNYTECGLCEGRKWVHKEGAPDPMIAALQAAIPLFVEGFVPSEKIDSNNDRDPAMQNYRYGYNSCRRDFLAKVKK